MKRLDFLVDANAGERAKRLKDYQKVKTTAPDSYKSNSLKEAKCADFLAVYCDQYLSTHKNRKMPFLVAENEYGVKKCVCSSIRPTTLPMGELGNCKDISNFIAHFIKHLPLPVPTETPKHLFSPSSVLDSCLGDSFEISTLLCSLLLGVGYDAYVVSGLAPASLTCKEEPEAVPDLFDRVADVVVPSEVAAVAAAGPPEPPRPVVHCWVFIAAGSRELAENCFVDPFTGQVMSTKLSSYSAVDSLWNHQNYWINTHLDKPVSKIRYDLSNSKHWLQVFQAPSDSLQQQQQQQSKHPSLVSCPDPPPFSWVLPLVLNRKKYQTARPLLPPPPPALLMSDKVEEAVNHSSTAAAAPSTATASEIPLTRPTTHHSRSQQGTTGLVSDLFDKNILTHLETIFTNSKHGNNSLTTAEFKQIISEYIPLKLVENICRAIDVNDTGYVNYSAFTNYLIAAEAGSSLNGKTYITRLVKSGEQPEQPGVLHRDFIDFLVYVKKPCPMVISGGRDGQLLLWEPQELSMITPVQHRDSNAVYQEDLYKSMDTVMRAQCSKYAVKKSFRSKVPITSVCSLLNSGLLCVGSADGCVTIYELGNQDVCGRFSVDAVPTAIECFSTLQHAYYDADTSAAPNNSSGNSNSNQSEVLNRYVSVGDSTGSVHTIRLHQEFELSTDVGMKNKNQQYFAVSVKENYSVKQVHAGWINQMKYIAEVDSLISASVDGTISFLDVTRGSVSKVFTGHQEGGAGSIGVKTFSFSAFSKYIVSGGDRTMLWWDPFTLEVIMKIDTFRSPIVSIEVHDMYNKVFAILSNKTISVWHNITFEVLQVITDTTTYKPTDNLSAMVFAPDSGCLFTAGHKISSWRLERSTESMTRQDEEDLVVCLFNPLYHQVVMVKSLGLVKVYQAETGEIVRQFKVIPLDGKTGHPKALHMDKATGLHQPVIKHACFDKQLTRLVVTGFDLSVQLWNINDGSNLMQVQPQLYSTTLAHTYANLPRSISTVTYESVNFGDMKTSRKFIFIGNEYGNICGYQEANSAIEDVPVVFFRFGDATKNQVEYYRQLEEEAEGVIPAGGGKDPHLRSFVRHMIHKKQQHSGTVKKLLPSAPAGPSPSSGNKFIGTGDRFSHSTVSRGDVFDREGLACTDHAVLWVRYIENSPHLLVAYLSGTVTFWNLEKNVRTHDLSFADMGPVLEGMKIKTGEKALAEPPEAVSKYLPASGGGATAAASAGDEQQQRESEGGSEGPTSELPFSGGDLAVALPVDEGAAEGAAAGGAGSGASLKKAVVKLQTQRRVSAAFLHKARVKKEAAISLPTVIEGQTQPAAPAAALSVASVGGSVEGGSTAGLTAAGSTAFAEGAAAAGNTAAATAGSLVDALGSVASLVDEISSLGLRSDDMLGPEDTLGSLEGLAAAGMAHTKAPPPTLPPLAHGRRRDSAAAVVRAFQQPSSTGGSMMRKNVLVPRRSVSMNVSDTYGSVELDAYQGAAAATTASTAGAGNAVTDHMMRSSVSTTSTTTLEPPTTTAATTAAGAAAVAAPKLQSAGSFQSLASSASEGSSYSTSSSFTAAEEEDHSQTGSGGSGSGGKVVVDCVAVLPEAQVIIGACSDRYLRFWDLSSHHILCSCCYYHRSEAEQEALRQQQQQGQAGGSEHHSHRAAHHTFLHKNGLVHGGGQRHHTHHSHHHSHRHHTKEGAAEDHTKHPHLHHQHHSSHKKDSAPIDEVLRTLKTSDSEDLLIGAYDNGMIRLWSIQSYSIVTLRSLLSKHHNKEQHEAAGNKDNNSSSFGYGLAISPITLLYEWSAHRSPVLSIEYLWFEDEAVEAAEQADDFESAVESVLKIKRAGGLLSRPATHTSREGVSSAAVGAGVANNRRLVSNGGRREKKSDMGQEILEGYIMSAGLDQRVFLWNVKGQCVGEFGSFGWDIGNESTWFKKNEALLLMSSISSGRGKKGAGGAGKAALLSSDGHDAGGSLDYVDYDDAAHILTSFHRHKNHTVKELSSYVEELTKKILNKPPSYLDVNKQFSSILETHPIKVIKDSKYRPPI